MNGPTVSLVPLALDHVGDFVRYCGDASLWTWWLRKPPVDAERMSCERQKGSCFTFYLAEEGIAG